MTECFKACEQRRPSRKQALNNPVGAPPPVRADGFGRKPLHLALLRFPREAHEFVDAFLIFPSDMPQVHDGQGDDAGHNREEYMPHGIFLSRRFFGYRGNFQEVHDNRWRNGKHDYQENNSRTVSNAGCRRSTATMPRKEPELGGAEPCFYKPFGGKTTLRTGDAPPSRGEADIFRRQKSRKLDCRRAYAYFTEFLALPGAVLPQTMTVKKRKLSG